jgi:hypothetical protein
MKIIHLSEKEALSIAGILLNRQYVEKAPTEEERIITKNLVDEIASTFGVRCVEEPGALNGWKWRKSV